ncbi:MAG: TIM-barrel domain-containing protein [Candidatus Acidiferrales bacterium]
MRRSKYIPARGGAARIHSGASSFIARNLANCGGLFHSLWRREIPRIVFALLVLLGAHVARAQQAEKDPPPGVGNLGRAEVKGDTLTLHAGADAIVVQVVETNILRVHYQPQGQTSPPTPVLDPNRVWSNDTPAKIDTDSDPLTISTDKMVVKISKSPVRFAIYDAENHLLMQEPAQGGLYSSGLRFACKATDPFFGIDGTAMPGKNMDARQDIRIGVRRSGGLVSAGRQGDAGAPLVYTPTYGLLVDSDGGDFDIAAGMLQFSGGSRKDVEYFAIVGDPKAMMHAVADISGHPPMMPKWTLGFMNSQYGSTQAEVTQIIDTYRAKQIPIDGFILDFDWKAWGEDDYGEWRWNSTSGPGNVHPDKYPDGASGKFAEEMSAKGIKLAGIFKPRIVMRTADGKPTEAAQYGSDHKLFFDWEEPYLDYFSMRPALDVDFSKPAARAWFWEHMIPAYRAGLQYFWNDEADSNGNAQFPNFQHADMERAMYEGARSIGDQRVWSINRNFYLGAQRYAYGEWSGDIWTGFPSMNWQEARMLSTIGLGEPHWSMDTGGFDGRPNSENYARWVEFAALVPIMRVHGSLDEKRQPWVFGEQAEADAKAAIELRYRLIPYMYSYERQAHETGVGVVRPLFWDFPNDGVRLADITDEWMFGDSLLAAPVRGEGQARRTIYLPAGHWFDYFRGQQYEGGKSIVYSVNPETWADIPLFIRAGAILPTQDVQQYVGEHPVTSVVVDVFPTAAETSFDYYDDDGISYAYEKGAFFEQRLSTSDNGTTVRFDVATPTGTYKPPLREYEVKLHGISARTVTIDGAASTHYDDLAHLESASAEGWTTATDRYGPVSIVKITAAAAKRISASR